MNITSVADLAELSKYGVSSASTAKGNRNEAFETCFRRL
jgi:hypothetical protein